MGIEVKQPTLERVKERLALIDRMRAGGEAMQPQFSEDDVRDLIKEIEQLKLCLDMESAELAWSDSDGRSMQAERDQLKAEKESLRKDAERYHWLTSREGIESGMHPTWDGGFWIVTYLDNGAGGIGGGVHDANFFTFDEAVDFAMSKMPKL